MLQNCTVNQLNFYNFNVVPFKNHALSDRIFHAAMGRFICGRQTHGHPNHGPQKMDSSRLVDPYLLPQFHLKFDNWVVGNFLGK